MRKTLFLTTAPVFLLLAACGGDDPKPSVEAVRPKGGLDFAYVDVAKEWGYTLRNRSGKDHQKDHILEAMPPGLAVADYDGDGFFDIYCPNGNRITKYDPRSGAVTLVEGDDAPRNELYFNRGGKRFEAGGKAAGVDDPSWAFGSIAGDVDNDGDPDIYVCNWGLNRLYLNDGKGRFTDVAAQAGVQGDNEWSTGPCFFDYDKDGDLDLYVAQYADMRAMLANPRFTKVAPDGSITGRQCEWKGIQVYCGPRTLRPLNDVLFKNMLKETGELRFEDVTKAAGCWFKHDDKSSTGQSKGPYYGFQPTCWDIDGDGWLDLFVANDTHENICWINQRDGTFKNKAILFGMAISQADHVPQASMGVAVGDINLDGLLDVTVTEFSHDQYNLYLGRRFPSGLIGYEDIAHTHGLRDMTFGDLGWGALMFDPDMDGDCDLFFCNGHVFPEVAGHPNVETTYKQYNKLILNEDPARPRLRDVSGDAGPGLGVVKCSRGAVFIDLDNDGDPDIATSELNDLPTLLRCDRPVQRSWLAVRLRGNPDKNVPLDPVGALVRVTAAGSTQTRIFQLGSSFMSSEDPRLLFGLGDAKTADVEVLWPNGEKTRKTGVKTSRLLTLELGR